MDVQLEKCRECAWSALGGRRADVSIRVYSDVRELQVYCDTGT